MRKLIAPDFISYPSSQPPRGWRTLDQKAVCFQHDIYHDSEAHCFRPIPQHGIVEDFPSGLILRHVDNFHDATPFGFKRMVIKASELRPDDILFDASPARKYWLCATDAITNFDYFIKNHETTNYNLTIIRLELDFLQPEIAEPEQSVIIPASYGGW